MSKLNGAACTAASDCKKKNSCCSGVKLSETGSAVGSTTLCWPPGTDVNGSVTPPADTTIAGWTSGLRVYSTLACTGRAVTLGLSAAAAATSLYVTL